VKLDKEQIRASVDVEAIYTSELGYPPSSKDAKNLSYICPWHSDKRTPNLKVNVEPGRHRGSFKCFACPDAGGDIFAFVMEVRNVAFPDALETLAERAGLATTQTPRKRQTAKKSQTTCTFNSDYESWPDDLKLWVAERGYTLETIQRFNLAHALYNGRYHALAIPYDDPEENGYWKLRFYRGDHRDKFTTYPSGRSQRLYEALGPPGPVILCEGELDALRAAQEGFAVASSPNGAATFKSSWAAALEGRDVAIVYDLDDSGREGAEKAAKLLCGKAASVKVVGLPESLGEHGDQAAFYQAGGTAEDLRALIKATPDYSPKQKKNSAKPPQSVSLLEVQETVTDAFGEGAWFVVRCCLSVCATLLIEDVVNPTGLNLVGPPSSLKTTILGMFYGNDELVYVSDSFSPASFVSLAASIKESKLEKIDLLPKMQHKIFIVPELAPVFQKRSDDLVESFAILTRVFDGEGLKRDGGTGSRGYHGDYLFAWLGATTPLPHKVWSLMGKLGSRFLFLTMPDAAYGKEKTRRVVANLRSGRVYRERKEQCREVVNRFLTSLWTESGGVRGVKWDNESTDENLLEWIANIGRLISLARSTVSVWRERYDKEEYAWNQPTIEEPDRLSTILFNVARGHALINGRTHLTIEDITPIVEIGLSSMPDDRRQVLQLLLSSPDGRITSAEVKDALSISSPTARAILEIFGILGIGTLERNERPIPWDLTLAEEFHWARLKNFRSLRASEAYSWIPF